MIDDDDDDPPKHDARGDEHAAVEQQAFCESPGSRGSEDKGPKAFPNPSSCSKPKKRKLAPVPVPNNLTQLALEAMLKARKTWHQE